MDLFDASAFLSSAGLLHGHLYAQRFFLFSLAVVCMIERERDHLLTCYTYILIVEI